MDKFTPFRRAQDLLNVTRYLQKKVILMTVKKIFIAVVVSTLGLAANASLVTNGGFETGDLSGWTANGWQARTSISGVNPNTGNYFADTGCVNTRCTLSQTLSTTAGGLYDLAFSFNPGQNVTFGGGDTQVFFDGNLIADINGGALGWTNYLFTGLTASTGSTTLLFSGFQNPAWNGVDDVSVTGSSSVPEPETLSLMGLALAGLAATRRKLRKSR